MAFWDAIVNTTEQFSHMDPRLALIAVFLYAMSIIIVGLRWQRILSAMNVQVRLRDASIAWLCGIFANNISPARMTGEACRVIYIHQRSSIGVKRAAASVIYDRLTEIVPILVIVSLALHVLKPLLHFVNDILVVIGLMLTIFLASYLVLRKAPLIRRKMHQLGKVIREFRIDSRALVIGSALSTLLWLQDLVRLIVVAQAFGIELSLWQAASLSTLTLLGSYVPTIGGLGAIEGGLIGALYLFGVDMEVAIAITALERGISFALGTLAGGTAVVTLGGKGIWKTIRSYVKAASRGGHVNAASPTTAFVPGN